MKFFGKLAATLLSLSFCFSAFGCADLTNPPDLGNSGSNGGSSGGEQEQTQIGETLANAIMGQLEEANTLTFSLDATTLSQTSFKDDAQKENDYYDEETISLDGTLAKTESGYDLAIAVTLTATELIEGELVTATQTNGMYIIDGITYTYSEEYDAYLYNPYDTTFTSLPDLNAIVDSLKTEEIEQFKAMLGEALTEVYNVTEGNIAFAYDGKDDMNALLDYVGAIDPETKTIESIVNDVLALIDEELTVASILAEIEKLDTVTVGDAVAEIDAYLTENADTTLQGLKDELIADERIVALLQEQGMTEEDIAEIEATVLADVLEPYKDMLLDEIVYDMVISSSSEEGEAPTYEQFILSLKEELAAEFPNDNVDSVISYVIAGMVKPALATTIAQAAGEDITTVNGIIGTCASSTMNAFDAAMDVEFNEYFQIETMSANGNIEMVMDDETVTSTEKASFAFTLDSISKDVTEIALPKNAKTVFAFWLNDDYLEHNTGIILYSPIYDIEAGEFTFVEGSFYPSSTSTDYVHFTFEVPTEPTATWEITITGISIDGTYYIDEDLATLLNGNLTYTLTFDYDETGDYIVDGFEMPTIEATVE